MSSAIVRLDRKAISKAMIDKDINLEGLAREIGMSKRTLYEKLNRRPETFTYLEMLRIVDVMELDFGATFYAHK